MNNQIKSNLIINSQSNERLYPLIPANKQPIGLYPNLNLSLDQENKNLSNQSNGEFSLSISRINHQQNTNSASEKQEQCGDGVMVSRSSKFFNSFNEKSRSSSNEEINNSICLNLIKQLSQEKREDEVYESEDGQGKKIKANPNKTQIFMRKFNDSRQEFQQKDINHKKSLQKSKGIKISYDISSSNENEEDRDRDRENLDELTTVINKAKQQIRQINKQEDKQIRQKQPGEKIKQNQINLCISRSFISDNLQSFSEEPVLGAIQPMSRAVNEQQIFKKTAYYQKQRQSQNSDGVYDQESENQEVFESQQVENEKQQCLIKIEYGQHIEQKIEQKQLKQVEEQKIILPQQPKQPKQPKYQKKVKQQQQQEWSSEQQDPELQDGQEGVEQGQDQEQEYQQEDLQSNSINLIIIGIYMLKTFTPEKITSLRQTTQTYYPSNYFHTGPRYQMMGVIRQLVQQIQRLSTNASQNEKKYEKYSTQIQRLYNIKPKIYQDLYQDILQELGLKTRLYLTEDIINLIQSVLGQYYSSNYFHVGPRRQMFSWVSYLIQLVEKSRKAISQKTKGRQNQSLNRPNIDRNQQGRRLEREEEEEQEQEQEQEEQQEQELSGEEQEQQVQESEQEEQNEQSQDEEEEQQAADVINNSIHQLLSNYGNNNISVLSTERSFNIEPKQIKYSIQDLKNYQIGKKLKQDLTPALIQSLTRTLMQYNSSNYFHVGPRYQLLGFMGNFAKSVENLTKNGGNSVIQPNINDLSAKKVIKIGEQIRKYMSNGKIQQILNTCSQYDSSNYFHVGPRYSIFGDVRKLISLRQI